MAPTEHAHKRFPERLAFLLNNPIRKGFNPPGRLISKLDITRSDVAIDFGCGAGFFTIPLAKVAAKTIAIDASSRMLEKTARYAKKNNVSVELLKSDGTEIKLRDGSVDLILLVHVFHEVEQKSRVLKEFLRVLRAAGRLVIVEKTQGSTRLSGVFGPPVVQQEQVVRELELAGFTSADTIRYTKDSLIIGRKPPAPAGTSQ
jgi:ubiquinone/menaquinone biosynthesis C-methylase UbiE